MLTGIKFCLSSYEVTFSLWFLLHWTEYGITAVLEFSEYFFGGIEKEKNKINTLLLWPKMKCVTNSAIQVFNIKKMTIFTKIILTSDNLNS